ncbi:MAG TPA: helix-turn-helix domain-containing protein [Lamprocystis sp. (in: g-proteobacteria)]|nr:helix-turn-helix domain-containing protein [Lamprocystis sp. (in: g-proteobacteria)]
MTAMQDSGLTPTPIPARAAELRVVQVDRTDPLGKCVQAALETYLHHMDGHDVHDLYRLVIEEVERPLFETVLRHADGNLTQAASLLGLTRSTLRKRLADYGIARGR